MLDKGINLYADKPSELEGGRVFDEVGENEFEVDDCLWYQDDDGMKLRSVITHKRKDGEEDFFEQVKTGSWTGHSYI